MISRRDFGAGALALAATPGLAIAGPPPGRTGWILMDAESGATVDSQRPDDGFIPASTMKSVTACLALSTLSPTARFLTRLHGNGPLRDGVLDGDLTLVGGADPALDTTDLGQLAKALKTKGIRRVTGRFLLAGVAGPETPVLNPRQPLQANYNPAIGPFCLNFNRVLIRWQADARGLAAIAHSDGRSVRAESVRVRAGSGFAHGIDASGREVWTLPAGAMRRRGERWMPVRDPAGYAGAVFRTLCAAEGIVLPLPQRIDRAPTDTPIAVHRSDVLFGQLKKMMKYSTNLTAEAMGIAAATRIGGVPATVAEAAQINADWLAREAGVGGAMRIDNHSGLSTTTRVTPRQVATVLHEGYKRFGGAFAALHTEGKVRGSTNGLPAYDFRAKTGTMNYVRSLAGFLETPGRRVCFVIFSMEPERRAAADAAFSPWNEARPRGEALWLRAALDHENALLRDWLARGLQRRR